MTAKEKDKEKDKKKAMVKIMLLMGVGFVIDVAQAVIVYNTGKGAEAKALGHQYKWTFPVGKELMQTAGIVLATSFLTGLIVNAAETALLSKEDPNTIQLADKTNP